MGELTKLKKLLRKLEGQYDKLQKQPIKQARVFKKAMSIEAKIKRLEA